MLKCGWHFADSYKHKLWFTWLIAAKSWIWARAGALVQKLKLPAWKVGDRGFQLSPAFKLERNTNVSSLLTRKDYILWSLRYREVASSTSVHQNSNFESCVWRAVSSHSSHHPQEVLLARLILYVNKCGLRAPFSLFHFGYDRYHYLWCHLKFNFND